MPLRPRKSVDVQAAIKEKNAAKTVEKKTTKKSK